MWVLRIPFTIILSRNHRQLFTAMVFCSVVVLVGLPLWSIIILPPTLTALHHGSFFFPILISIMGALIIATQPKVFAVIFGFSFIYHLIVWMLPHILPLQVGTAYVSGDVINPLSIFISICCIAAIFLIGLRLPNENPRT